MLNGLVEQALRGHRANVDLPQEGRIGGAREFAPTIDVVLVRFALPLSQLVAPARGHWTLAERKLSVAHLQFRSGGSGFVCTGTLINDTNFATQVPYVLTAAHCVDSAATAATVNAFFFYQAATCGGSALTNAVQIGSGAHLMYVNTTTDVALLRLNEPAPAGAFFSGWDPTPLAEGNCMVMIHHPDGGPKAYSVGTVVPTSLENDFTGDHQLVTWRTGSSVPWPELRLR